MREDSPFTPGFGNTPPVVAGRAELIHQTLSRIRRGPSHEFHTIILGARGTGKTTVINAVANHVRDEMQSPVLEWNASDRNQPLARAVSEQAPDIERELSSRLRRGMKRLEGGASLSAKPAGVGAEVSASFAGVSTPGEQGSVVYTLTRLGRIAASRQRTLLVRVDELQAGSDEDLTTLGATIQTVANEKGLPVSLLAAGLASTEQVLHGLAVRADRSPSAGFLERQDFDYIHNLDVDATYDALEGPILDGGWTIDAEALDTMVQRSSGYPFAVQLIGQESWRAAHKPGHIGLADVDVGVANSATRMVRRVYLPRWRKMSPTDRTYLRHAAALSDDTGAASTAQISSAMYGSSKSASRNRDRLIDRHDVLEAGVRGTVRFTIPGMARWIRSQPDDSINELDSLTRGLETDRHHGLEQ